MILSRVGGAVSGAQVDSFFLKLLKRQIKHCINVQKQLFSCITSLTIRIAVPPIVITIYLQDATAISHTKTTLRSAKGENQKFSPPLQHPDGNVVSCSLDRLNTSLSKSYASSMKHPWRKNKFL